MTYEEEQDQAYIGQTCTNTQNTSIQIVPQLSESTWWSSDSVMYFLESFGAKDQLPGHQRLIDSDINVNKQTNQHITSAKLSVFYRA